MCAYPAYQRFNTALNCGQWIGCKWRVRWGLQVNVASIRVIFALLEKFRRGTVYVRCVVRKLNRTPTDSTAWVLCSGGTLISLDLTSSKIKVRLFRTIVEKWFVLLRNPGKIKPINYIFFTLVSLVNLYHDSHSKIIKFSQLFQTC